MVHQDPCIFCLAVAQSKKGCEFMLSSFTDSRNLLKYMKYDLIKQFKVALKEKLTKIFLTLLCGALKGFMKAFKAPQRSVKINIYVNFFSSPGIGTEKFKHFWRSMY